MHNAPALNLRDLVLDETGSGHHENGDVQREGAEAAGVAVSESAATITSASIDPANAWTQRVYTRSESSLEPPSLTALQALRQSGSLYIGRTLPQRLAVL